MSDADFQKAISPEQLYQAALECKKGVYWKGSIQKWMQNATHNILELHRKLKAGTYKIRPYREFELYVPKHRIIRSTYFCDRVVQRSLCNNGIYKAVTSPFVKDNIACQKGKGTEYARSRVIRHLKRFSKHMRSTDGYFVKLDLHSFFDTIPHESLKEAVKHVIIQRDFRKCVFDVIDSFYMVDQRPQEEIDADPFGRRGIALGSQLSQLLALLYLNDFDHYVKEQLHVKHYVRYMDDMLFLTETEQEARKLLKETTEFLVQKGLSLNPKSHIGQINGNCQFLKTNFRVVSPGRIKMSAARKTINNEIRRVKVLVDKFYEGTISRVDFIQHFNTWHGFAFKKASRRQLNTIRQLTRRLLIEQMDDSSMLNRCKSLIPNFSLEYKWQKEVDAAK